MINNFGRLFSGDENFHVFLFGFLFHGRPPIRQHLFTCLLSCLSCCPHFFRSLRRGFGGVFRFGSFSAWAWRSTGGAAITQGYTTRLGAGVDRAASRLKKTKHIHIKWQYTITTSRLIHITHNTIIHVFYTYIIDIKKRNHNIRSIQSKIYYKTLYSMFYFLFDYFIKTLAWISFCWLKNINQNK